MPLSGGHELLVAAERGGYAVPGFNVSTVEMLHGVLDAAQTKRSPTFVQFNPSNLDHIGGVEVAASLVRTVASRVDVPVALHLDHSPSVELVRQATQAGFTSLMFDGSTFPFERNRRETMAAYAVAHEYLLALEAELGHVGGREAGVATSERVLTDPERAARFVADTHVDSLAVSVGTAHGLARCCSRRSAPQRTVYRWCCMAGLGCRHATCAGPSRVAFARSTSAARSIASSRRRSRSPPGTIRVRRFWRGGLPWRRWRLIASSSWGLPIARDGCIASAPQHLRFRMRPCGRACLYSNR